MGVCTGTDSKVNPENKGTESRVQPRALVSDDHSDSKVNPENKGTERFSKDSYAAYKNLPIARLIPKTRELKASLTWCGASGLWQIARLIPKTRELKAKLGTVLLPVIAQIARLIPKTRELKVRSSAKHAVDHVLDSKVNPENKGTERHHPHEPKSRHLGIARLIPKTRELKE